MKEHNSFNPEQCSERTDRIGYEALMEVASRYGFGEVEADTLSPPEITPLAYHNAQHTIRVRDAARTLAAHHGLNTYDSELAVMIASAHDIYHDHSSDPTDEIRSAQWLVQRMRQEGFSDEDCEIAELAIRSTAPIVTTTGRLISQEFTLTMFPSQRAGEIALVVAAADLEALFAPHGPAASHDLYKECIGIGAHNAPATFNGLVEFQQQQIELYTNYQPLYPMLEQFFGGLRKYALAHHQAILEGLKNSTITTWQHVVDMDTDYYHRHRLRSNI
ncbi:MAG: HD domain-containing protein [Candidatus Saccharimonas sp.]